MAMSAGLQTTAGYGFAASAAHSIPMLDGNKKSFKDFQYKLRACALELGLEEILLRPEEWKASQQALQQRIQERTAAGDNYSIFFHNTVDRLLVQA